MLHHVLEAIGLWIQTTESHLGYPGVVLLMAIESACIPLPSEVIMPFAGSLIASGRFGLWTLGLVGALGCVVGSIPAYFLGALGGRPLVERYGRYVLLSRHDLALADRLFERHGEIMIFLARLLPVVRTFIALPAGISKMNLPKFIAYTFLGSLPWCLGLAYAGKKLGEHWEVIKPYFHRFDAVLVALIFLGAAAWIWRHVRGGRASQATE